MGGTRWTERFKLLTVPSRVQLLALPTREGTVPVKEIAESLG
jgi:hypothetical protein